MQKINKVHFYNRRNDHSEQKNSQFFFFVEKKKHSMSALGAHRTRSPPYICFQLFKDEM